MSFERKKPFLDPLTPCGYECRPLNPDYCIVVDQADQVRRVSTSVEQVTYISRLLCETVLKVTTDRLQNTEQDAYAIDELTGLVTRSAAKPQLRERIQLLLRESNNKLESMPKGVYLAFVDLDGFKDVNDKHPNKHAAGDDVLRLVGKKLQSITRKDDFLSRWGGDEIVVIGSLVPREKFDTGLRANIDGAADFGQRVLEAVTFDYDGFPISASIGVVTLSQQGLEYTTDYDVETQIMKADSAMYVSKQNGKGRVTIS